MSTSVITGTKYAKKTLHPGNHWMLSIIDEITQATNHNQRIVTVEYAGGDKKVYFVEYV